MLCEVVNMYGEPESMSSQELYSVMVQVYWQLKQRAWENMQVWWCRKDIGQLHHFDWKVSLVVPTPSGCRVVSPLACRCMGTVCPSG